MNGFYLVVISVELESSNYGPTCKTRGYEIEGEYSLLLLSTWGHLCINSTTISVDVTTRVETVFGRVLKETFYPDRNETR